MLSVSNKGRITVDRRLMLIVLQLLNRGRSTNSDSLWLIKPFLLVDPANLLIQWIRAFDTIAKGMFQIWRYHGDIRASRHNEKAGEKIINEMLTRKHDIFRKDNPQSPKAVILTTYET